MASPLTGLTGAYYPPTVVKVYDPNNPTVAERLLTLPIVFSPTPSRKAKEEISAYGGFFHSTLERQLAQQLMEEGRFSPSAIEPEGLPESFGELVVFVKSLAKGGFTTTPLPGATKVPHSGTTPTGHPQQQSPSERGSEEAGGILSGLGSILTAAGLKIVLALAGLALVVYGVMVAVRPRETALTLPVK